MTSKTTVLSLYSLLQVAALAGVGVPYMLQKRASKPSAPEFPKAPKTRTVSHVSVKVTELTRSKLQYYISPWAYRSIVQKQMPGMAEFIAVESVTKEMDRLRSLGFEPIASAVTDRPGDPSEKNSPVTIVGYSDPDNNMVELVSSMTGGVAAVLKTLKLLGVVRFPMWVHINANATSFEKSWKAYQQLGFTMNVDYKRVENRLYLYQALAIPDPGIAKQVSLIKPPKGMFNIDLIEWEDPVTRPCVKHGQMTFSLTVDDVAFAMDEFVATAGN
jgi:hypothetical protein